MNPTSYRSVFAMAAFGLAALPSSLSAQIVWDGDTDNDFEEATNWVGDIAPVDDTTTDIAQLVGGTVDVTISRSVAALDLVTAATTLSGGGTTLTLGGGLSGSQDLALGGSVTLALHGTDTSNGYTGNIYVGSGTTLTSERNSIKHAGADTLITLDGGTLSQDGDHLDLTGRDIVLDAGGGTLVHVNNRNIFGGFVVSGVGQLTLRGANTDVGRVQLTEINTYSGGTLITDGAQAWLYNDSSFGTGDITFDNGDIQNVGSSTLSNNIIVNAGGAEIKNNSVTLTGSLSGSGDLTLTNTQVNINSSSNTFSGNTLIDGSTLEVSTGGTGFLGTSAITLDNGGTISGNGQHVNMGGTSLVIGSGGGTLQNFDGRAVYGLGDISGDGLLTLDGDGSTNYPGNSRIQLSGTGSTYTGGTLITNKANAVIYGDGSFGAAGTKVTIDDGRFYMQNNGMDFNREIEIASGGGAVALGDKNDITFSGLISGTGALEINGQNRDNDDGSPTGILKITSANNTLSGAVTVREDIVIQMSGNNALGTGTLTLDEGAQLKNNGTGTNPVLDNNVVIGATGGELMAGWNASLTLTGEISGSGDLTVVDDSGDVILTGNSSAFAGATTSAGTLYINGSLGGNTTITSTGTVGGSGTQVGDLTLDAGATFAFSETVTLTVGGTFTLDSTFGIDDLVGISSSTNTGIYTLVDNGGDFSHLENFGLANAFDLGGGREAYFQNGSLQVVVIPEPSIAVLGGLGILGLLRRRRN